MSKSSRANSRPQLGAKVMQAPAAPVTAAAQGAAKPELVQSRVTQSAPAASAPPQPDPAALELLLRIEDDIRRVPTVSDLRHLIVNEIRKFNGARQVALVEFGARNRPRVTAMSGIGTFEPSSALVTDIEMVVARLRDDRKTLDAQHTFTLPAYAEQTLDLAKTYPFREWAWVPLMRGNAAAFAGLLVMRETIWSSSDLVVSARLAGTAAHAWRALAPPSRVDALTAKALRWKTALIAAGLVALVIPVPLTALAPAEVVAREPELVTAPLDGVIDNVDVDPSATVKKGDVLVRLVDTTLRNRRDVAAQEVAVGEARVKQATLLAFSDAKGRYELGLAQADLDLKKAELAYAADLLGRTTIRATRNGMAVFADKRSLIGKPVATGERLMDVADPLKVEVRIDVAAPDAIALASDARARIFLDVEPLAPRSATLVRTDYRARPSDADVLSFRAFAKLDNDAAPPRLGLRGTAQVIGDWAPLSFVLLRRPIAAVRQWIGL